jgi:hypothetical protein
MIQRIQSIYLLLGGIGQIIFATGTYFVYETTQMTYEITGTGIYNTDGEKVGGDSKSFYLGLAVALFSIVTIFLYKNRKQQIKFSKISGLITITEFLFLMITYFNIIETSENGIRYGFAGFMVPVTTILFFLAHKSIKKDDALVRSVDRIR